MPYSRIHFFFGACWQCEGWFGVCRYLFLSNIKKEKILGHKLNMIRDLLWLQFLCMSYVKVKRPLSCYKHNEKNVDSVFKGINENILLELSSCFSYIRRFWLGKWDIRWDWTFFPFILWLFILHSSSYNFNRPLYSSLYILSNLCLCVTE